MTGVLLVSPVAITDEQTGPAIRCWELARVLAAGQPVTLLVPNADHPDDPGFAVKTADDDLDAILAAHRVIVVQGPALQRVPALLPALEAGSHFLVADLYDPITLEQLEIDRGGPLGCWLQCEYTALLNQQLRLGDFFVCASERQRAYWLGALSALGRINPHTYDGAELRTLIDIVPFGLPAEPPRPTGPVIKGVLPGVASSDRIIVWGGGLWDWLDPLTPIRAMERVARRHPTARLLFFDSPRNPSPGARRARQLAEALGLLDWSVLFAPWLPPHRWGACLLEADVGLSFHPRTIETHLAFRTRLLDYVWAGLPIVTAAGDVLSDQVASLGLGYAVEPGDCEALSEALIALLDEPDARGTRREAFARLAEAMHWKRAAAPLVRYCQAPWRAGDAGQEGKERQQAADRDALIADVAGTRRRLVEAERRAQAVASERDQAVGQAAYWQAQAGELAQRAARGEAQLRAVMNGRVMRLMTGLQRTVRSLRGSRP